MGSPSLQVASAFASDIPLAPEGDTGEGDEPIKGDGLIFTPAGTLRLVGNTYIVPLRLEAPILFEAAQSLVTQVRQISGTLGNQDGDEGTKYMAQIAEKFVDEFQATLDQLLALLRHHLAHPSQPPYERRPANRRQRVRNRRGAAVAVGLAAVGGLATGAYLGSSYSAAKVDNIHEILTALKSDMISSIDEINVHSRILNITTSQAQLNENSINELSLAHNKTLLWVQALASDIIGLKSVQMAHGILIHLNLALSAFRDECRILDNALSILFGGYIHPYIMNDDALLSLLTNIESNNHKLLFTPQHNNVRLFREITAVTFRRNRANGTAIFYFLIPMLSHPVNSFDLYSIDAVPLRVTPKDKSPFFATVNTHFQYISISDDSKFYMLHTKDDIMDCMSYSDFLLCPPSTAIYSAELLTCEAAIFFNKPLTQNICSFTLKNQIIPQFKLVKDKWLYSINSEMSFYVRCPHANLMEKIRLLNSSGLMQLPDSCDATSDQLQLPSTSQSVAKRPELFSHQFNRTKAVLTSSQLVDDASAVITGDDLFVHKLSNLNFNTELMPLLRKIKILNNNVENLPVPANQLTNLVTIITVAVVVFLVFQVARFCGAPCKTTSGCVCAPRNHRLLVASPPSPTHQLDHDILEPGHDYEVPSPRRIQLDPEDERAIFAMRQIAEHGLQRGNDAYEPL